MRTGNVWSTIPFGRKPAKCLRDYQFEIGRTFPNALRSAKLSNMLKGPIHVHNHGHNGKTVLEFKVNYAQLSAVPGDMRKRQAQTLTIHQPRRQLTLVPAVRPRASASARALSSASSSCATMQVASVLSDVAAQHALLLTALVFF